MCYHMNKKLIINLYKIINNHTINTTINTTMDKLISDFEKCAFVNFKNKSKYIDRYEQVKTNGMQLNCYIKIITQIELFKLKEIQLANNQKK
jgi:hypothetical protein